jgi:hypothetical protein
MRWASLALDSSGHPHVSFYAAGLKYARYDGVNWHIETVEDEEEGQVGFYASLALTCPGGQCQGDASDRPHISYCSFFTFLPGAFSCRDLKYAQHDGTNWHVEVVDDNSAGSYTSLALDASGRPHIGYGGHDAGYSCLKHAWYDGMDWRTEIVDGNGGSLISLALDSLDHLHISYASHGGPKYARYDGARWRVATIEAGGSRSDYCANSLALDGTDRPHIAYLNCAHNDLKYTRLLPSLDNQAPSRLNLGEGDTLTYVLTLSGPGPDVRLFDPLPEALHYVPGSLSGTVTPPATYDPAASAINWQGALPADTLQEIRFQAKVDAADPAVLSAPIVNTAWLTDVASGVVISSTTRVSVMLPLFLDKRATPDHGLRGNDTLTYTLTFSGSGLNARLWDPLPPSLHYVPGSLGGTVTPAAVYSPTAHAITWQGTLPTDTASLLRFQVTPGVSGTGSLSLLLPIANTAWLTDTQNGRGVSATAIVNGQRIYLPCVVRVP